MLLPLVAFGLAVVAVRAVARILYNIFRHPLRHYPGPVTHAASRLPWAFFFQRGQLPQHLHALHARHGPVVRVAPDELSFTDAAAWPDLYGHRVGANADAHRPLPRKHTRIYRLSDRLPETIINTGNEAKHAMLRRTLAPGFSDKSMRAQEPIIGRYVGLLVERLREMADRGEAANMTDWYTFTTFDIIGDLALGSAFGCLEGSGYHPWVRLISASLARTSIVLIAKLIGWDWILEIAVWFGLRLQKKHLDYIAGFLSKRRKLDVERPDFIEGVLQREEKKELSPIDVQTMASVLVVAGSETTATLMCGVTYLLLRNPNALDKVTAEVRAAFNSDDEITLTSVNRLAYMLACLNEALRMYPPVAGGLPRIVPNGFGTVAGVAVPDGTIVSIPMYAAFHSEENWTKPFEYHPERFLGDPEFASDKVDVLHPFSIGPRNCIGKNLAYAEMRLVLARILYNFDMRLAEESIGWMEKQEAYFLWRKPSLSVYMTPTRSTDGEKGSV